MCWYTRAPVQLAWSSPPGDSGYEVLPANGDLTAAEVELLEVAITGTTACAAPSVSTAGDEYSYYVLIDCPPSLNMLTINGLVAADGVMIAMQCEYFALEGLAALLRYHRRASRDKVSIPHWRSRWILRTNVRSRATA